MYIPAATWLPYKSVPFQVSEYEPATWLLLYRILTNLYYTGYFTYNGQTIKGNYEPLITMEEFDRVQALLGKKGKPRPQKHQFAFTGLIKCGECGCLHTAETKKKLIKSTGEYKEYTYYHCTRKKTHINCSQHKVVREEELEAQIDKELQKYTILPEFLDWAVDYLEQTKEQEARTKTQITEKQQKTLDELKQEFKGLIKMNLNGQISEQEFIEERNKRRNEIAKLECKLNETENKAEQYLELSKQTFELAAYARKAFLTCDRTTKREIFTKLGQNPTLKDGKLSIQAYEWLVPIAENYPALETEYLKLEPTINPEAPNKKEALASIRTKWWS